MSWPEPVERVAVFLRASGAESRLEEFTSAAASAQGAAEAIGCDLDQIVKSLVFICDDRPVLALVPGDRRADPAKVGVAAGASGGARRPPARGRRRDRRVAGRRGAVSAAGRSADLHRAHAPLAHGRLGRGRLRPPHGNGVARRARAPDAGLDRGHRSGVGPRQEWGRPSGGVGIDFPLAQSPRRDHEHGGR